VGTGELVTRSAGEREIDFSARGGRECGQTGEEQQMTEFKGRWKGVTDKEKWAARGASFLAKAKATKVVWFPPEPVESSKKAASRAKEASKKPSGAAKKSTKGATRKTKGAAKKSTGAATKSASDGRNVTNRVRRKKA
jgi:hypothetical protein